MNFIRRYIENNQQEIENENENAVTGREQGAIGDEEEQ